MTCLSWLTAAAVLALLAPPQAGEPSWLKRTSRVSIVATIEERPGTPGGLTLLLDVTPLAGVHVYAPGNAGYTAPTIRLDGAGGVRLAGTASFPAARPFVFGDLKEVVQVYGLPFRIRQPLAVDRRAAGRAPARQVSGTLEYQACTPKICFPPHSEPFSADLPTPPGKRR